MRPMPPRRPLPLAFYRRPATDVARDLLGRWLAHETAGGRQIVRLVEVEAYLGGDDPASHAFRGPTRRNAAMFLAGGHAYVYLIYGLHLCINVVCGEKGVPHAVLLRSGEAVEGEEAMAARRGAAGRRSPRDLAGGPGRLTAALGIGRELDGAPLWRGALRLLEGEPVGDSEVAVGARIGVDYAGAAARWPLRFGVASSRALSRPFGGVTSSWLPGGRGRRR